MNIEIHVRQKRITEIANVENQMFKSIILPDRTYSIYLTKIHLLKSTLQPILTLDVYLASLIFGTMFVHCNQDN